jgi:hypothetical protein
MSDGSVPPSPQHRDDEVLRHVLREVRTGRPLDEVLADPYVAERREGGTHARVLDHPEVAEAVGAEIVAELQRLIAAQEGESDSAPQGDPIVDDARADELRRVSGDS